MLLSYVAFAVQCFRHFIPQKQKQVVQETISVFSGQSKKDNTQITRVRRPREKCTYTLQRPLLFHFTTFEKNNPDFQSRCSILESYSELSWHPWVYSGLILGQNLARFFFILMKCQVNHEDSNIAALRISICTWTVIQQNKNWSPFFLQLAPKKTPNWYEV